MDDEMADETLGTRIAHWLRPSPAELLGLAVLLLGAMTASAVWWFQAVQRPSDVVNQAVDVGSSLAAVKGDDPRVASTPDPADPAPAGGDVEAPSTDAVPLTVHVSGAVRRAGVVTVAAGARVADAVAAAGGLRGDALTHGINLARPLTDGEQVHVPREGESPAPPTGGSSPTGGGQERSPGITSEGRVDLNLATREELETLPGVGPSRAEAIVAYREQHGPFAVPGDLRGVRGIGEATFQGLADLVTVG